MRRQKNIRNKLQSNRYGTTMVEVLVAFVILMIGIAGLTRMIQFASNMYMESTDNIFAQEDFQKSYYQEGVLEHATPVSGGTSNPFFLQLDKEKTDVTSNKVSGITVKIPMDDKLVIRKVKETIDGQSKHIYLFDNLR